VQSLLALSRFVDRLTVLVGQHVSWLVLVAVLVSAGNAIIRKVFDISSNAWLELQWYLFGTVFMLAAAYTLQRNEHIRIDILSGRFPKRIRDWIDVAGHALMLLPLCALMSYLCWIFFWKSWVSGEVSGSAGGLVLWPARLAIFAGFVLLLAQGLSELIKRIAVLRGEIEEPYSQHDAHTASGETP
jgi:TRAP-type mannitol/chloroaromatic compound transport system permease small subunit